MKRDIPPGSDAAAPSEFVRIASAVFASIDLSVCSGCDECGLRCEAGVAMSQAEFRAVQQYVQDCADRAYVERVRAQCKEVNLGEGVRVRLCTYRDMERGRCAIYPVRPLVCRLMGHVEWLPCPIHKVRRIAPTASAVQLMKEYSRETRRTFEEWEALLPKAAQGSSR